jgi:ABC-type polysaccharide/polyol phosphate export permease
MRGRADETGGATTRLPRRRDATDGPTAGGGPSAAADAATGGVDRVSNLDTALVGTSPRSSSNWGLRSHLSELVANRELLGNLTLRELRSRYKKSVLGWTWSLINPLANVVIYSIVFSVFLKVQPPTGHPSGLKSFPLFLLCALVPWTFFSTGLVQSTESLLLNANLIKKTYFPRELLVMASVGSVAITMLIETAVLAVILLITGNMVLVWLPVVVVLIALQAVLVLGIGLMLSVLNVYFRDFRYLITILLQVLFYATPIVYPIRYVPRHSDVLGVTIPVRYIYNLNPLTRFMEGYRDLLYETRFPSAGTWAVIIGSALVALTVGWAIFGRLQRRVAEEV